MSASIDLVVVNYKTYDLLQKFIDSYMEFPPSIKSSLLVIDVAADESKYVKLYGNKMIKVQENIHYSGACNLGVSRGFGKYVAVFNADTRFVDNRCVDQCVEFMEADPSVGAVGPLQYTEDGRVTHAGIFGENTSPRHRGWQQTDLGSYRDVVEAVTVSGSALFTPRSVWSEMESCDVFQASFPGVEGALPPCPHFFEETTYVYHLRSHGYKAFYLGEAEMIHEWHKSSPVGSQGESFKVGQGMFRSFCDSHGIEHD